MEKQYLDFEVARDFFIEMKYYTIQNYLTSEFEFNLRIIFINSKVKLLFFHF